MAAVCSVGTLPEPLPQPQPNSLLSTVREDKKKFTVWQHFLAESRAGKRRQYKNFDFKLSRSSP
jgi:hypothetical protein